jgi:hypothetical protein
MKDLASVLSLGLPATWNCTGPMFTPKGTQKVTGVNL